MKAFEMLFFQVTGVNYAPTSTCPRLTYTGFTP